MGKNYVISDIHGRYDAYLAMLDKIGFTDDDTLYILGDVLDRGPDGIKALLDIMSRKNVIMLLGNHENTANEFFRIYTEQPGLLETAEGREVLKDWFSDGGEPTIGAFLRLDNGTQKRIVGFIKSLPRYMTVNVGGRNFMLSHTVPAPDEIPDSGFDAGGNMLIPPAECIDPYGFIWGEPDYGRIYNRDYYIVTGHTPTGYIDERYVGKVWCANNHIAIDCGAVFGYALGCVCLDTLKVFYVGTGKILH